MLSPLRHPCPPVNITSSGVVIFTARLRYLNVRIDEMQLCGIFEIKRGKNQQTFSFSHTKSVNKTAIFAALHDLNHLSIAPACPKFFAMEQSLFPPKDGRAKGTCERSRKSAATFRADLDGTIFPYDCSMRLAHVMSTTRIVSSNG